MSQADQPQVATSASALTRDQFIRNEASQLLEPGEEILEVGMVFEPIPTRKALPIALLGITLGAIAEVICAGPLQWPTFPGIVPAAFLVCLGLGWPIVQGRRWFAVATGDRLVLIRTSHIASRVNRGVDHIDRSSIKHIKRVREFGATTYTLVLEDGQPRCFAAEWGASFLVSGQGGLTALLRKWRREIRGA